jgi:hypothetical protein
MKVNESNYIGVFVFGSIDKRGLLTHHKDGIANIFIKNGIGRFIITSLLQLPSHEYISADSQFFRICGFYSNTHKENVSIITHYFPIKDFYDRPSFIGVSIMSTHNGLMSGLAYSLNHEIKRVASSIIEIEKRLDEAKLDKLVSSIRSLRDAELNPLEVNESVKNMDYKFRIEKGGDYNMNNILAINSTDTKCVDKIMYQYFSCKLPFSRYQDIIIGSFSIIKFVNKSACKDIVSHIDSSYDEVVVVDALRVEEKSEVENLNSKILSLESKVIALQSKLSNIEIDLKQLSEGLNENSKELSELSSGFMATEDFDAFLSDYKIYRDRQYSVVSQLADAINSNEQTTIDTTNIDPVPKENALKRMWNKIRPTGAPPSTD